MSTIQSFRLELAALLERASILCGVRRIRVPDRIRDELYLRQNKRCADCGERLILSNCHADHIYPLALGGTNDPQNLQLLHPACNLRKGAMDPYEYARQQGRLL